MIDFSKYLTKVGDADAESQTVICQTGAINEKVNVIANGFSCKTQVEQSDCERRALHVAQVAARGLRR